MAVVGTAHVRLKLISDKLAKDIKQAVDNSLRGALPNADKGSRTLGDKITDNLEQSVRKAKLGRSINKALSDGIDGKELGDSISDDMRRGFDSRRLENKISDAIEDGIDSAKDKVEITVVPRAKLFAARMLAITRPVTKWVHVKVDPKSYRKALIALNRLSGGRVLDDFRKKIENVFKNMDRLAPIFGLVAAAVGGLITVIGSLVGFLAIGIKQLAALAGGLILLPGLFLGGVGAIASLVVSMKGLGEHLEDVKHHLTDTGEAMQEAFRAEAVKPIRDMVKTLFPAMRDNLVDISREWGMVFEAGAKALSSQENLDRINAILANTKEMIAGLAGGVDGLINGFLRLGEYGSNYLPHLGEWLSNAGDRLDAWVKKNEESGQLDIWVKNAGDTWRTLGGILGGLVGTIAGLASAAERAGGGGLKTLEAGLQGMSDAINSVAGQEGLTSFFTASRDGTALIGAGFSDLGGSISRSMDTIEAVMRGGSSAIGDIIGGIGEILENPSFQTGLTSLIDGFGAFVGSLRDSAGDIGGILGGIGTLASTALGALGPLFQSAFGVAAPLVQSLSAALTPIINSLLPIVLDAFSQLTPLIAPISAAIEYLGGIIGEVFTAAAPVIALVAGIVVELAQAFMQGVESYLPQFREAFDALKSAVDPLIEALMPIIDFIMPILTTAFELFAGVIMGAVIGAIQGVTTVFNGLKQFLTGIVTFFSELFSGNFKEAFAGLGSALMGILKAIVGAVWTWLNVTLLGAIRGGVVRLLGSWKGGLEGLVNAARGIWSAIQSGISAFLNFVLNLFRSGLSAVGSGVSSALGFIRGIFTSILGGIRSFVNSVIGGIVNFFVGMGGSIRTLVSTALNSVRATFTNVLNAVRGVVSSVLGAIRNTFSTVLNAARSVVSGALNAIRSVFSNVLGSIRGAVSSVLNGILSVFRNIGNGIRSAVSSAMNGAKSLFTSGMNGMKTAVTNGINNVISFFRGLPGKVKGALGNLGSALKGSGKALISGFVSGIQNGFSNAMDAVKRGVAKIRNFFPFSPAKEGAFSGRGYTTHSGMALMQDFGKGIADGARTAVSSAGKAMSTVASALNMTASTASVGEQMARGLADGISAGKSRVARQAELLAAAVNKALQFTSTMDVTARQNISGVRAPASISVAPAAAGGGAGSGLWIENLHISVDADDLRSAGDLVDMLTDLPRLARQGRRNFYSRVGTVNR